MRSQKADLLQAQYFQQILAAEHDEVADRLATHTANFRNAELAHDLWRMQFEHREMQALEPEVRKLVRMLRALDNRFRGA